MLPKHRLAVCYLPHDARLWLRSRHIIPPSVSLFEGLRSAGWGQATLVLELLRLPPSLDWARAAVASLTNVQVLRPAVPPWPPHPVQRKPRTGDERRVIAVGPNPRLPTTPSFQRYRSIRYGLSVAQLLQRGVTRKDLRELTRGGHVSLESESAEARTG